MIQGKNLRIPIWLTTLIVIILILLFSRIIYDAREMEMVEQFNGQQMAIAKGIASGIEDLIAGIEKSIKTLSALREKKGRGFTISDIEDLKFFYWALEGKAEFIARSDGSSLSTYPVFFEEKIIKNLKPLIMEVSRTGETYIGHMSPDQTGLPIGSLSEFVVIATPELDSAKNVSGVLFAAISLSNIVQRYIDTSRYNTSTSAWIIDQNGIIIHHPDVYLIGKNASVLESRGRTKASLSDLMQKANTGSGIFNLREDGGVKRKIVSYAPVYLNLQKWFIAVETPHKAAIAHLKTTFYMIMIGAFFLISAVAVGGWFMVQASKKRIRLEEELKHLREKDGLQERLAQEKRLVEGIIEGSPIPMFVINRDHRIIFWNRACSDLTGCKGADMIGTDTHYLPFYQEKRPMIADLIVDLDKVGLEHYYGKKRVQQAAMIEGAFEAYDFYENLGGKRRHLYFLAAPIHNENGETIAAIETLQDVSRERQMELDLKEYAESLRNELDVNINLRKGIEELYAYLQSIVKSSPDKIYALDSNGIINYVSHELDGPESMSRLKGIHFTDLVSPENRAIVLKKWEEGRKGSFRPYELEAKARDGSKRNLLVSITPIKGSDKFIIVQRDITEFKELEKKFYESQQLAAVGQLSAGIAHEVRNPLSSIKMSLHILEKRLKPGGNDLKRFKIAEKEVEHLEKLVSDILIYARPDQPDLRATDINAFVEHSIEMAEKIMADKKITVSVECDPALSTLKFDAPKLGQALLNLYLNAIDAISEGGVLRVATKAKQGDNGKEVQIIIEDNGCGIDEKDIPYIFNPFFTKKSHGTGLGLSQVKRIIALHQGTIEVFSKVGEGTRVVITLPVVS